MGPRRDTARVEAHGKHLSLDRVAQQQRRQAEQHHVKEHQDAGEVVVEEDLDNSQQEHQPYTHADCPDEQAALHDGAHLAGQHG